MGAIGVTTDAVVWIEIIALAHLKAAMTVTTDAVVWIEISAIRSTPLASVSPLMQWCGLKSV